MNRSDLLRFSVRCALVALFVAALAFAGTFLMKEKFQAQMSLYFPLAQTRTGGLTALAGQGDDGGGTIMSLDGALVAPLVGSGQRAAVGLLKSREARVYVAKQLDLPKRWDTQLERAVAKLGDKTELRVDENGLLWVSYISPDRELARQIVDAYYQSLNVLSQRLTINVSRRNREIVADLRDKKRAEVAGLEQRLVERISRLDFADRDSLRRIYLEARAKLASITADASAANASLASIDQSLQTLYREARTSPGAIAALGDLAKALQERAVELETARRVFAPNSAELREVATRAGAAQKVTEDVVRSKEGLADRRADPAISDLAAKVAGLAASANSYATEVEKLRGELVRQPQSMVLVDRAKRDLELANEGLAQLEREYQVAVIAETRDPSKFELVDAPYALDVPVAPNRRLIAMLAFAFAALVQIVPLAGRLIRPE